MNFDRQSPAVEVPKKKEGIVAIHYLSCNSDLISKFFLPLETLPAFKIWYLRSGLGFSCLIVIWLTYPWRFLMFLIHYSQICFPLLCCWVSTSLPNYALKGRRIILVLTIQPFSFPLFLGSKGFLLVSPPLYYYFFYCFLCVNSPRFPWLISQISHYLRVKWLRYWLVSSFLLSIQFWVFWWSLFIFWVLTWSLQIIIFFLSFHLTVIEPVF